MKGGGEKCGKEGKILGNFVNDQNASKMVCSGNELLIKIYNFRDKNFKSKSHKTCKWVIAGWAGGIEGKGEGELR